MALISSSVPNLNGGVSQQPSSQRLPNQCEEQENAVPLLVGGLTKRPPTNHVAEMTELDGSTAIDLTDCFTHFVSRDVTERFVVSITGNPTSPSASKGVRVHDIDGSAKEVLIDPSVADAYLDSDNPGLDFRALTIGDVTFLLNRDIVTSMDESELSTTSPNLYEALIWIKRSQHGIKFEVVLEVKDLDPDSDVDDVLDTITFKHTPAPFDFDGESVSDATTFGYHPDPPATSDIAASIGVDAENPTDCSLAGVHVGIGSAANDSINGMPPFSAVASGSVIYLWESETTPGREFSITVKDSLGQSAHSVVKKEVMSFSDLPKIAKHGMKVLVKGDPESEVDDYYVVFEKNGLDTVTLDVGEGIWVEAIAPGIAYKWDYNTMPLILIRQSDGKFLLKRADGEDATVTGFDDTIDYSLYKWGDRESGSDLTNPQPSFAGRRIKDMTYFKNRLAFASGEDCALSEAAELFNFYRTTTTLLLDTSPVDVGAGGTEVNAIERAVPFSGSLVLFSEKTQFTLTGEGILSPLTAAVNQATNFDTITSASPITIGNSLLFAFNRGGFSGIREFYKTNAIDINFDAFDITTQVPKYISGEIVKIVPSSQEDLVTVLARTKTGDDYNATDTLYLYKYYKSGTERLQSAWSKFVFTNASILDANIVGESMYLIVKRGLKTFLERMDLQNGLVDTGADYVTTIDRRVLYEVDSVSGPTKTLLDIGYKILAGDTMQVVSTDGELMTIDTAAVDGTTIVLKEDVNDGDKFYIGTEYTMRYELTAPTLKSTKEGGGGFVPVSIGRHQIRYMTVSYDATATFIVRITPKIGGAYGTAIEYPFTGRFLSAGGYLGSVPSETGSFRFPVFAESDAVKIEILNGSPLPSNIQAFEFEASYNSRTQPRN